MTDQNIVTPVGRIVQGSGFVPNTTDQQGNTLVTKSGPNAGQPRVEYYIGLAIAKDNPEWAVLWEAISGIAVRDWPAGQFNAPTFSWKYIDGDSVDKKGKAYSERDGFAGHHILRFSSGYAPQVVTAGGAAQISDASQCKRGDYARVVFSCRGNGNAENPGLYMNLNVLEHIGYGAEITSGPDAATLLAGAAPVAYVPAGMSATPVAPATTPAAPVVAAPVVAAPVVAAPLPQGTPLTPAAPVVAAPVAAAPVAAAPVAAAPVVAAPVAAAPVAAAPVAPHGQILAPAVPVA